MLILPVVALSVVASGCDRSHDSTVSDSLVSTPAASYKEGFGVKLSAAGAAFIDLKAASTATLPDGKTGAVDTVPVEALLRTVKGDFVYVQNGEWFLLTPVSVGLRHGDQVEIKAGLYEGDTLVVNGVRDLWLAQLQATNGGGHVH